MNASKTIAVLALSLVYSGMVAAGCGEQNKRCYLYKGGKLVSQSQCSISACANPAGASQNWKWKNGNRTSISLQDYRLMVNGKQGFTRVSNNQSCYGANNNRGELFCLN